MAKRDSLDKIIQTYLACVCTKPFVYDRKLYEPKPLRISPELLRGFICPENCGGCCPKFTLDYLPAEYVDKVDPVIDGKCLEPRVPKRASFVPRTVRVSGSDYTIITDMQDSMDPLETLDHAARRAEIKPDSCKYLNFDNGRCNIHSFVSQDETGQPFSCDFELIRFTVGRAVTHTRAHRMIEIQDITDVLPVNVNTHSNRMTTKLFNRYWCMKNVDGSNTTKCEILEPTNDSRDDVVRKLKRLLLWAEYFNIETCIAEIIEWAQDDIRNTTHLYLNQYTDTGHHEMQQYSIAHLAGEYETWSIDKVNSIASPKQRAEEMDEYSFESPTACVKCGSHTRMTYQGDCLPCFKGLNKQTDPTPKPSIIDNNDLFGWE